MPRRILAVVALATVALTYGYVVAWHPQIAFVGLFGAMLILGLSLPVSVWVVASIVATFLFKGLVTVGVLPSVATFSDIFLAWGALAAALLHAPRGSSTARRLFVLLGSLCAVAIFSALANGTGVVRPIVYIALLGVPFVIVLALILSPPTPAMRRIIGLTLLLCITAQVPLAYFQAAANGIGDSVQGSLLGAGAGAHVVAAIAVVGAVWIAFQDLALRLKLPIVLSLLIVPLLTDAKQVVLATPAMILAGQWRGYRDVLLRGGAIVVAVMGLFAFVPAGKSAAFFLERASEGRGGKQEASRLILDELRRDPATAMLGVGPAESVSRAAFMTTPLLLHSDSPLQFLGLPPARLASDIQLAATDASGGGTSFDSGISSALGVLGDLGAMGLLAYAGVIVVLYSALRRSGRSDATAAVCSIALFTILGLVFDWWEQPPFSIVVGTMIGLALTPEASK